MEQPQLLNKSPVRWLSALIFFSIIFGPSLMATRAHAFPEMIRYGYVNCNSCHVSLNGGGVLTDYGRELSREELAVWKNPDEKSKEHLAAYGVLAETPIQKYLKVGGDLRALYLYKATPKFSQGQTYFMQGDLEAAFVKDQWTMVGAAGVEEPVPASNPQLQFVSRRHYVQYSIDDRWNVRVGRFVPSYGINTADHVAITRSRLMLGYGLETYNLEVSRISEQWNFFVTGTLGRTMQMENQTFYLDSGVSGQVAYAPTEKMKIGVNAWYGKNQLEVERVILGGFALLGLTSDLVFETEIDFPATTTVNGIATTQKLSYQVTDGLWPYLMQEFGKTSFTNDQTKSERYGIGVQFFPRAHFEFDLLYEKRRDGTSPTPYTDYAYLLSHFYI